MNVPAGPTGPDYRVRVISAWAPEMFDDSDAPFTILGPPADAGPGDGGEENAIDPACWMMYE